MKDNDAYKGDWSVKRISNPAYKGFWEAKKIANPEYEDDDKVYSFAEFGFIGFDLWQVKGGLSSTTSSSLTMLRKRTPLPRNGKT